MSTVSCRPSIVRVTLSISYRSYLLFDVGEGGAVALLALAGCASGTTAVDADATPHGFVEGASEHEEPQLGLVGIDAQGTVSLLDLVAAAAEIDLAAWEGRPQDAVDVAMAAYRRLRQEWDDDHLGMLRLAGTPLTPVAAGG